MAQAEEHVDFIPKPGVTLYVGNAAHSHDPEKPLSIPKSLAEAWEDYRHQPEPPAQPAATLASAAEVAATKKKVADKPDSPAAQA